MIQNNNFQFIEFDEEREPSALSFNESKERKRTVLVTLIACLVMLPFVLLITGVILKGSAEAGRNSEDDDHLFIKESLDQTNITLSSEENKQLHSACSNFSLDYQNERKKLSKQFSSEPLLLQKPQSNTLSAFSRSELLLDHDIEIFECE